MIVGVAQPVRYHATSSWKLLQELTSKPDLPARLVELSPHFLKCASGWVFASVADNLLDDRAVSRIGKPLGAQMQSGGGFSCAGWPAQTNKGSLSPFARQGLDEGDLWPVQRSRPRRGEPVRASEPVATSFQSDPHGLCRNVCQSAPANAVKCDGQVPLRSDG